MSMRDSSGSMSVPPDSELLRPCVDVVGGTWAILIVLFGVVCALFYAITIVKITPGHF